MVTVNLAAHLFAGLLVLAGIGKVVAPWATQQVLTRTRLPSGPRLVRALGAGEAALGLSVLAVGGAVGFAVLAAVYLGFVVLLGRQRRAGVGCGCFGTSTGDVGPIHVTVDVIGVVTAALAATTGAGGLASVLPPGPVALTTTAALLAVACLLVRLVLTSLAELAAARRLVEEARS